MESADGDGRGGWADALARRLVDARPGEWAVLGLAALYHFLVLAAWYVLRPIRDAMGTAGGVDDLPWLFTATLLVMLAAQPLYAAVVARWPRPVSVPWTYRFFALHLLVFWLLLESAPGASQLWLGRAFFVWASVFNLFIVSVFWSFVDDLFEVGQGKRLFGFVAAGGTLGGVLGAALTAGLVERLGEAPLLLVSAALLEGGVRCARALGRRRAAAAVEQSHAEREAVGGGALAGVSSVLRSPYLAGICGFLFLYTLSSTFLYFVQADIVTTALPERSARTAFFARLDLWVNASTLVLQTGATGRVLAALGVGGTLALLPALSLAGFAALGALPTLGLLALVQVARRASNFALTRPAREILFIPLSREEKYKSKAFVDTFVYRLGDQVGAWTSAGLTALGLGVAGIAGAAAPLAALWLALTVWLGRRHARLVRTASPQRTRAAVAPAP